jgi:hypothetical protein
VRFEKAAIPLGFAWSSPFVRWQGALADMSSLDLAVDVTRRALEQRGLAADEVEKMKLELLRLRFDEQVRGERRFDNGVVHVHYRVTK